MRLLTILATFVVASLLMAASFAWHRTLSNERRAEEVSNDHPVADRTELALAASSGTEAKANSSREVASSDGAAWRQFENTPQHHEVIVPTGRNLDEQSWSDSDQLSLQMRFERGKSDVDRSRFSSAKEHLLIVAEESNDARNFDGKSLSLQTHVQLSRLHLYLKETNESLAQLAMAEQLFQELQRGNHQETQLIEVDLRKQWADHYRVNIEFEKARNSAEEAVTLAKQYFGPHHVETGRAYGRLASVLLDGSRYSRGRILAVKALSIFQRELPEDHVDVAEAMSIIGLSYYRQRMYAKGKSALNRALRIRLANFGENHILVAYCYNDLAILAQETNEFAEAERLLKKAIAIKTATLGRNNCDTLLSVGNLGVVYSRTGFQPRSIELYKRQAQGLRELYGPDNQHLSVPLSNLAVSYLRQGRRRTAIELTLAALKNSERHFQPGHDFTENHRVNLAGMYRSSGKAEQAFALFDQALAYCAESPNDRAFTATRIAFQKAELLGRDGRPEAKATYEAVLASMDPFNANYTTALKRIGILEAQEGRWSQAMRRFDEAVRAKSEFDANVLAGLSEDELLRFCANTGFEDILSIGLEDSAGSSVLERTAEWILNTKSRAIEVLSQNIQSSPNSKDADTHAELIRVRERLAFELTKPASQTDALARQKRIQDLQTRQAELSKQLGYVASHERKANLIELDEVRSAIPEDAVLIEIRRMRTRNWQLGLKRHRGVWCYAAWIIPPIGQGDIELVQLGDQLDVDQAVDDVRAAIRSGGMAARGEELDASECLEAIGRLSEAVWHPLEEHVGAASHVIISPDQSLWLTPWSALTTLNGGYLIESHRITMVNSGRDLLQELDYRATSAPTIVADVDYNVGSRGRSTRPQMRHLPGTQEEARTVLPILRRMSDCEPIYLHGKHATEAAVKNLRSPSILLLSTHGFAEDLPYNAIVNPLVTCGLACAGANNAADASDSNDGILTGLEVVNLELDGTELVVLSACDSGVGTVRSGQGVNSLRQAMQLAGAKCVMATLWPIPDRETAGFIGRFFDRYDECNDASLALQLAKIEVIKSQREKHGTSHPLVWSAFTVTERGSLHNR